MSDSVGTGIGTGTGTGTDVRGRPGVIAVVSLIAFAVLSGCTADGDARPDPDAPSSPDAPDDAEVASPLGPYLDELWGDRSQGDPDPWALRAEEVVAACMAEQGFEYRIDEMVGVGTTRRPDGYGTVAFAEQYGYGQSIPFAEGDLPMLWNEVPIGEGRSWNIAYRDGLSPEARAAYDVAMDGVYSEASPDYDPMHEGYDPQQAGCRGRATDEVFPGGSVGPAELADVKAAVDDVWRRVEEDPRVVEALSRWSTCMADAGHPGLANLWDAESLVGTVIFEQWQEEWIDETGTDLGVTDYDVVRVQIPDGLAELRQAEVDLAVADARCRESSGYLATYRAVELEVEQEVVDTYRADLEAWVAWIRENRPGG